MGPIRSIATLSKGLIKGISPNGVCGTKPLNTVFWQTPHDRQKLVTSSCIFGQRKLVGIWSFISSLPNVPQIKNWATSITFLLNNLDTKICFQVSATLSFRRRILYKTDTRFSYEIMYSFLVSVSFACLNLCCVESSPFN